MKIRLAFAAMKEGTEPPWLVSAVDELTEAAWNEVPTWYREAVERATTPDQIVRECWISVPDEPIEALFSPPEVEIAAEVVAVEPPAPEAAAPEAVAT